MARARLLALLLVAVGVLCAPASALALDNTSTKVVCTPGTPTTGTSTSCDATVTDTEASPVGTPGGIVTFTSKPGGKIDSCALGSSGSCPVPFKPSAGGDYTITATYAGDGSHSSGTPGSTTITAVDRTTTTFSCTPATVPVNSSTSCTAMLSDATSPGAPVGTINFTAAPSTGGSFGTPGACHWQPSGSGGSATCQVTFTPTTPGSYSLTATYGGDHDHAVSAGTTSVNGTPVPSGGGPGSKPGTGSVGVTITNGPPAPGTLAVAKQAKVSRKHVASLGVSCAGKSPSRCSGTLFLSTTEKVKVRVKVPVIVKVKVGKGKHRKTVERTEKRTKVEKQKKTIVVGSAAYNLGAGGSKTLTLKLSKAAVKVLSKARRRRLKARALVPGAAPRNVTLIAGKQKHHKHKHKAHKKHKKHKKK